MKIGEKECPCEICCVPGNEHFIGKEVTDDEIGLLNIYAVMSDDWLSLAVLVEEQKWFSDKVFMMETEDKIGNMAVQVDGKVTGFEFLRSGVTIRDGIYYPIRDAERVLMKIYHGSSNLLILKSTVVCMAFQSGVNERLYRLLFKLNRRLVDEIRGINTHDDVNQLYGEHLENRSEEKLGTVLVKCIDWFPSFQDVIDFQTMGPKNARTIAKNFALGMNMKRADIC